MVVMVIEHVLSEACTKAEETTELQACDTECVQLSMEHIMQCFLCEAVARYILNQKHRRPEDVISRTFYCNCWDHKNITVLSQMTSIHDHGPSSEVIMNKTIKPIVYEFETRNSLDQNTVNPALCTRYQRYFFLYVYFYT